MRVRVILLVLVFNSLSSAIFQAKVKENEALMEQQTAQMNKIV